MYESFGFSQHLRLSKGNRKNSKLRYEIQMEKKFIYTGTYPSSSAAPQMHSCEL